MRRPAGVVLLSVFFACLASIPVGLVGAALWRGGLKALIADPAHIIGVLGIALMSLLLGFLAYGLWDLDEDARWVAFAFFSGPTLLATVAFAAGFNSWNGEAARQLAVTALFGAPCIYLQLRPIRHRFVQLVLLNLSR